MSNWQRHIENLNKTAWKCIVLRIAHKMRQLIMIWWFSGSTYAAYISDKGVSFFPVSQTWFIIYKSTFKTKTCKKNLPSWSTFMLFFVHSQTVENLATTKIHSQYERKCKTSIYHTPNIDLFSEFLNQNTKIWRKHQTSDASLMLVS